MVTDLLKLLALSCLISTSVADPGHLESLSWGIRNRGDAQQILIDHFTSGIISGVAGEDVHLPAPVAGRQVKVAVLDTGIDPNHPDLSSALSGPGFNAITGNSDTIDTHGHGTHVAGIIGARSSTPGGFSGVSSHALLLPVKVVQTGPNAPIRPQSVEPGAGTALTENVAKGIEFAVRNGAEVIHLSLAWPYSIRSARVDAAIEEARKKKVIIVASAGNDRTSSRVYPCIYSEVICVGAHGPDGAFSHFSNHGPMVDLLAPGTAILSAWPMKKNPVTFAGAQGYEFRNGTSMAAPFVSGAVAEMLSRGIPAREIRARLIQGSRPTRTASLFRSGLATPSDAPNLVQPQGAYGGNLDISRSIELKLEPLLVPVRKGPVELKWNGVDREIITSVDLRNIGAASSGTSIQAGDESIAFDSMEEDRIVSVPVKLKLTAMSESRLPVSIEYATHGMAPKRLILEFMVHRMVSPSSPPAGSIVRKVEGARDLPLPDEVRTVQGAPSSDPEHVLIHSREDRAQLSLVRRSRISGSISLDGVRSGTLLGIHRLPDGSYCLISSELVKGSSRPSFTFHRLDSAWNLSSQATLGTEITVFPEQFQWARVQGAWVPIWIGIGFTPKIDLPAYDPWNSDAKDLKMPRVFYLSAEGLRTISFGTARIPLQLLPDGRVLTAQGNDYFQRYEQIEILNGKPGSATALPPGPYRMFSGAPTGTRMISLDGSAPDTLVVSGPSRPGDLRVTGVGKRAFDTILQRTSLLNSLVNVPAGFTDGAENSFFVESHHDLLWYRGSSPRPVGTTLNRYSYIPSMIFSRSLFGAVAKLGDGKRTPAIYIPAGISNAGISEVVLADPASDFLRRPALLRLKADPEECISIGNLVAASAESVSTQVFYCKDGFIQVPLSVDLTNDE